MEHENLLERLSERTASIHTLQKLIDFCQGLLDRNPKDFEIVLDLMKESDEIVEEKMNKLNENYEQYAAIYFVYVQKPILDGLMKAAKSLPTNSIEINRQISLDINELQRTFQRAALMSTYAPSERNVMNNIDG